MGRGGDSAGSAHGSGGQVPVFIHPPLQPSICLSRVLRGSSLVEKKAVQSSR